VYIFQPNQSLRLSLGRRLTPPWYVHRAGGPSRVEEMATPNIKLLTMREVLPVDKKLIGE
jgi:hypothetical protein